jgi:hypothetical protein
VHLHEGCAGRRSTPAIRVHLQGVITSNKRIPARGLHLQEETNSSSRTPVLYEEKHLDPRIAPARDNTCKRASLSRGQ